MPDRSKLPLYWQQQLTKGRKDSARYRIERNEARNENEQLSRSNAGLRHELATLRAENEGLKADLGRLVAELDGHEVSGASWWSVFKFERPSLAR